MDLGEMWNEVKTVFFSMLNVCCLAVSPMEVTFTGRDAGHILD